MSSSDSEISECEIDEYKDKPLKHLRAGKLKVKGPNGSLRCPFCPGKKKQDYKYQELLQHANGVGRGSSKRRAKEKANHLALAEYLKLDIEQDEHRNKKEWSARVCSVDGCLARDHDHRPEGLTGELKTVADLAEQASKRRKGKVESLADEINQKNVRLKELTTELYEKNMSLSRMQERVELDHPFCEASRRNQQISRERFQMNMNEQEKLRDEVERKNQELESWSRELNKRKMMSERDRQKLDHDKRKNELMRTQLQLACEELTKSDVKMLRLVEEQKREKEEDLKKMLELEADLNAKHKLQMEMEDLRGQLNVMQHMGDDASVQKRIEEVNAELEKKGEEYTKLLTKEHQTNDEFQEQPNNLKRKR